MLMSMNFFVFYLISFYAYFVFFFFVVSLLYVVYYSYLLRPIKLNNNFVFRFRHNQLCNHSTTNKYKYESIHWAKRIERRIKSTIVELTGRKTDCEKEEEEEEEEEERRS